MSIQQRLITLRRERELTQQEMADTIGVHVNQIRRYEAGSTQPSLDALKKIAVAMSVTIDSLAFDEYERGPDDQLKLQFEAISHLSSNEKQVIKELLDGMIIKYQSRRWDSTRETQPTAIYTENIMEQIANLHIEKLPEGIYLATSEDIPGLIAQGRTVAETVEIARDVAKKLIEAQTERHGISRLTAVTDSFDYPLIVGA
ncbi:MAG: helix-turn-helix domain-containing protein [Pseudomonadales bacterium]|nr:helix-turn-helix domain-containing protein [Pseudomonadales bacterium]